VATEEKGIRRQAWGSSAGSKLELDGRSRFWRDGVSGLLVAGAIGVVVALTGVPV
jgi:hypothetical protein